MPEDILANWVSSPTPCEAKARLYIHGQHDNIGENAHFDDIGSFLHGQLS
jgi:hypothetical protein